MVNHQSKYVKIRSKDLINYISKLVEDQVSILVLSWLCWTPDGIDWNNLTLDSETKSFANHQSMGVIALWELSKNHAGMLHLRSLPLFPLLCCSSCTYIWESQRPLTSLLQADDFRHFCKKSATAKIKQLKESVELFHNYCKNEYGCTRLQTLIIYWEINHEEKNDWIGSFAMLLISAQKFNKHCVLNGCAKFFCKSTTIAAKP